MFCQKEFLAHGLKPMIAQVNVASNAKRGTLRGMHFQYPPAAETKYVRCTRGAILDIIVDLRPESPTYLQHVAVELSADNQRGLYVPERFAHGYITLEDNTDTSYMVGEYYAPGREGGLDVQRSQTRPAMANPASPMHLGKGHATGGCSTRSEADLTRRMRHSAKWWRLMILVDTALQARAQEAGTPIRVGLIGAGFMVQGLTNMIINSTPGMRVVAISNRNPERAIERLQPTRARTPCAPTTAASSSKPRAPAGRSRPTIRS